MEATNIVFSRQGRESITRRELQSLLSMLNESNYEFDTVIFSCGYIKEIINVAIRSFAEELNYKHNTANQ